MVAKGKLTSQGPSEIEDEEEEEDDYDEERGVVYPSPLKYPLHPLQVVFSEEISGFYPLHLGLQRVNRGVTM